LKRRRTKEEVKKLAIIRLKQVETGELASFSITTNSFEECNSKLNEDGNEEGKK